MNISAERRKADNERTLMTYYTSKLYTPRNSSVTSGSSERSCASDNSKKSARIKHVMKNMHRTPSGHKTPFRGTSDEAKFIPEVFSKGYMNYCSRLPLPSSENTELIKKQNMWIPIMKWDLTDDSARNEGPVLSSNSGEGFNYFTTSLEKNACIYRTSNAKLGNVYVGSLNRPPLFGEIKLPPFTYQCTVDLGDKIYTLGGLTPSYCYSDEMPDLSCYNVDGVPNLPPPLLDSIVNNPSMVNNHDLYVISSATSRVAKPTVSGHIPPPLLCMTGSALTKRHIFFYGGFEIKTETLKDESTGVFYLKKRAVLSNRAYILDVVTFKFMKVDLVAQPTKFNSYPSIEPRFGHSQLSLKINTTVKCAACATAAGTENKFEEAKRDIDDSSPSSSQPIEVRSQSENSLSTDRNTNSKLSISTSMGVSTILILGGYRQGEDDDFETLNELWKIEVTVIARGKKNYFKFADTALATPFSSFPEDTEGEKWPARRAFQACEIYENGLLKKRSSEDELLTNLRKNFTIEPERLTPTSPNEKPGGFFGQYDTLEQQQHHHQHHHHNNVINDIDLPLTCIAQRHVQGPQSISQTLVIHGGSDKSFVFGDLWLFDLDTETWTQVATYKDSCGDEEHQTEVGLTLVGHKLVQVSANAVLVGGFTQDDVNKHWTNKSSFNFKRFSAPSSPVASLYLLDLQSSIFEQFCVYNERRLEFDDTGTQLCEQMRLISTSVIYKNGLLYLIGGILCNFQDLNKVYLRSTLTTCILPIIATPQTVAI
ncbi:LAME_0B00562g1_1 [Lachancea meyersii CBS 8951]|uniref:LAME_0B00562g1_1 n=1 Tax=Lachancea meyersii CBS 8951 TaxID=1266667 RepID=A0A1G4ISL4_9SACH|nr:LAME_0B00562g1_1 [Lachancea meyersii CBS 8951]